MATAKAKGKLESKPPKPSPAQTTQLVDVHASGYCTMSEPSRRCGSLPARHSQ